MKIGVFDSGLGGLVITKSFIKELPEYDYIYYGDTENLPYGDKTSGQILAYTLAAMKVLIARDCRLIIIACNTATSIALRYIQQRFIPSYAPDVKVLGVIIPTVEVALASRALNIGVVATSATVRSQIYQTEILKLNPELKVQEVAAPELVPAIENNDFAKASEVIKKQAAAFQNIDSLILGCTHYPLVKEYFNDYWQGSVKIVSQDELIGQKLKMYLQKHTEIATTLSRKSQCRFLVSRLNEHYQKVAARLFPGVIIEEI